MLALPYKRYIVTVNKHILNSSFSRPCLLQNLLHRARQTFMDRSSFTLKQNQVSYLGGTTPRIKILVRNLIIELELLY